MSKYHTTVSRRNFMKGLGLAGAGLGAAAATAPVFSDLDALASSDNAIYKEPWYVKELEIEKCSTDVDWTALQTWDRGKDPDGGLPYARGWGSTNSEILAGSKFNVETKVPAYQAIQGDNLKANVPGYQLKDFAYNTGQGYLSFGRGLERVKWTGTSVSSPEDRGVTKWTGTPEEANRMVRAAAHSFGISKIGVLEMTPNMKKLWSGTQQWADIDQADPDDSSRTIPNKCKYALVILNRQPVEMTKRGPSPQNTGATLGYMYRGIIRERMMRFIKSLGYQALDRGMTANVAATALSGIGELSRTRHAYTHEWGTAIRLTMQILTDLPLAPTKPIDFGGFRFCKTCKICGEVCKDVNGITPISMEDATYEITGGWNRIGVKAFQFTWPYDYFCNFCQAACPWTNHGVAGIHTIVKATAATTGLFNSFFANMENVMGYTRHWEDTDFLGSWWDRDLNKDRFDVIMA